MDPLFIDDSFTRTHTIAAVPGLHPAVSVVYRPALSKERTAYGAKLATRDPDQIERYETDLVARYVRELNGEATSAWKDKVGRISPEVRKLVIDQILGYTAAQEAAALGN